MAGAEDPGRLSSPDSRLTALMLLLFAGLFAGEIGAIGAALRLLSEGQFVLAGLLFVGMGASLYAGLVAELSLNYERWGYAPQRSDATHPR